MKNTTEKIEDSRIPALLQLMDQMLIYTHVSSDYERKTRDYGVNRSRGTNIHLHPIEVHLLAAIQNQEGISSQDLAKQFYRTKGAISQRIKVLHEQGLIEKRSNKKNYRIYDLFTTPLGRIVCENHARIENELALQILSQIPAYTEEEIRRFVQMVEITNVYLNEEKTESLS